MAQGQHHWCYICMVDDPSSPLICPCICKSDGQPRWVHRRCLDRWRQNTRDARYFTNCRECGFKFRYVKNTQVMNNIGAAAEERKRRVIGKFFANLTLFSIGSQVFITLMAFLVRAFDKNEKMVDIFRFPQAAEAPEIGKGNFHDAILYHKTTYYVCGLICSLALLGLIGTLATCFRACGCCTGAAAGGGVAAEMGEVGGNSGAREVFVQPVIVNNDPFCQYIMCRDCTDCCLSCCDRGGICDCNTCCENCSNDCKCPECSGGSGNCDCNGNGGELLMVILIAVIVLFAVIGIVVFFIMVVTFLSNTWARYVQASEMRSLTTEYMVEDLSPVILNPPVAQAAPLPVVQAVPVQEGMSATGSHPPVFANVVPAPTREVIVLQEQALRSVNLVLGLPATNPNHFPADPETYLYGTGRV